MKKYTRNNLLIALIFSITLVLGMFLGYKFLKDQGYSLTGITRVAKSNPDKLDEILHIINKNYVDEVNTDSLQNLPIDSMLHQLDPHSVYLPASKAQQLSESLEGNYEGVGIEYYMLNDTMFVAGVVKDGPAYVAGIRQGDKILKIDTVTISGRNLPKEKLQGRFKGKSGTSVRVILRHSGDKNPVELTVTRRKVNLSSIDASYMLNQETAYVRISKFGASTDSDFVETVKDLRTKGMKSLILDLRDNGGGYFNAATGLADQFLPENKLIVYTEGKHEPRTDYFSSGSGVFQQGKVAVLINENTASASEIVAGAIQDLGRGLIVGRRSFGKGLVQEQFPFGDGSALNLTIARYYTPSGKSIQKSYKKGYEAYQHELDERLNTGELTENKFSAKDSLMKTSMVNPNSPKRILSKGGIEPDIFVKLDTAGYNKFYYTLLTKKVMSDFVFDVLSARYNASDVAQNISTFTISEGDFKDFLKFIHNKEITVDKFQLAKSKPIIMNDLKALLCRYYLGDVGYYKAVNSTDNVVKQALSSLQ